MKTLREMMDLIESAQSSRPELRTWGNRATGETHYAIDGVEVGKDQYYQAWRADQQAQGNPDIKEQEVDEAISKKDLLARLQKDLPKVNDPKNKDAEPVNWTGPKKGDYGYTGYQGHGMPTDKQERARIRADKKKGLPEDEATAQKYAVRMNAQQLGSTNRTKYTWTGTASSDDQAREMAIAYADRHGFKNIVVKEISKKEQAVDEQATPEAVAKINSLFSR